MEFHILQNGLKRKGTIQNLFLIWVKINFASHVLKISNWCIDFEIPSLLKKNKTQSSSDIWRTIDWCFLLFLSSFFYRWNTWNISWREGSIVGYKEWMESTMMEIHQFFLIRRIWRMVCVIDFHSMCRCEYKWISYFHDSYAMWIVINVGNNNWPCCSRKWT